MGYSCKIYFRKQYVKQDGTCSIYLQVIINRKKKLYPLDLSWPVGKCEDSQNLCLSRQSGDKEVDEINLMLRAAVSRANEIFRYHLLAEKEITIPSFAAQWKSKLSRGSFTEYFEEWIRMRFRNKEIAYETWKNYNSTLNWLKLWKGNIRFMDLNERWAFEFDRYLKRNIKARGSSTQNSRWGYHKFVRAVLKNAKEIEKINFVDPYDYFSISQVTGTWKALKIENVATLYKYYCGTVNRTHKTVLRRFLFSVATSLRVSDLYRVHTSWLESGILTFKAKKTEKWNKEIKVPLSQLALKLWNDAGREYGESFLFREFGEQYSNRVLKEIAQKLEIKTNLHHHVARHTWTTQFLNNGGSVRAAQKILNHSTINTTMKYDHMHLDDLKKEATKMEFIPDP